MDDEMESVDILRLISTITDVWVSSELGPSPLTFPGLDGLNTMKVLSKKPLRNDTHPK